VLKIHRAERADALVGGLAELLSAVPGDPFVPDVVAVPSRGIERWISQALSRSLGARSGRADGICANVVFPSPSRLVADAVRAGSGIRPEEDPWAEHRVAWPLLEVIDACAGEPWCATLGRHLGADHGGGDKGRRLAVAQKLATLFTSYAAQRPAMLREWLDGKDTDGYGEALDPDLRWQAELWRRLRTALGTDGPAERIGSACIRLRDEPAVIDLPDRLSLFGATRLTTDQLQVIDALAERRDVHLWLPHPSHGLWARLTEVGGEPMRRRDDPTTTVPRHPLVGSLGRDAREMQLRLTALATPGEDTCVSGLVAGDSLLAALQRDIHEDRSPRGDLALRAGDRSVQVHSCHGRQRQVEVLREVLLGLFEDDPTLEPRDVVVMCPDIEAYAPLISAAFGLADATVEQAHPGHRLKVRLADRSLRQTNPVLTVVARLLELADGRLTAPELLDLAAMPPVRMRFGFDDEQLEQIGDWVRRSGVRWGLDAPARAPYALDTIPQNTWQAGLDRVLVGVTMDESGLRTVGLALPLDDVDSSEIDLAGRLAEYVDRVADAVRRLTTRQTLEDWVDALLATLDDLIAVPPSASWQLTQARAELTDALLSAGERAGRVTLRLPDIRALLGQRLKGRPTRANFRTGHLTICTMVPMRSVPHRVVCLLGLDDGAFPRHSHVDGDDILSRTPGVGERDPRSEDRQLFLDAILAAGDRLVLLYTGGDERTGAVRPPAVPVGELLDVLDQTARVDDGRVRDRVVVRHPLQPFDARNFSAGGLGSDRPFSFDRASYDGSLALLGDRVARRRPFLARPLPAADAVDTVGLDDLVRFLEHPVKAFLRRRLGLAGPAEEDQPADALPVATDNLQKWAIGDRLLSAGLSGTAMSTAVRAEWLRGELPPGALGKAVVDPIAVAAEGLVLASAELRRGSPEAVDVSADLDSGIRLVGTVPEVYDDRVVRVVYSRLGAKHRLRAWVQLLSLVAAHPDRDWSALTVGRGRKGTAVSRLAPPNQPTARALLESLVALYLHGQCEPLPLSPNTSCAYAVKRAGGSPPVASQEWAGRQWRKDFDGREIGDFDDADHRRVWGDAQFRVLLGEPADPGDADWPDEPTRFGQLARRVWDPLLAAERVSEQ
jgi:exodeoxyribonuclease V gamma subunit